MDGLLWGLVIVGGPILLGLIVFFFGQRHRRLTQGEKQASQQAARENWGKEQIR
jgi:hypothetical protein